MADGTPITFTREAGRVPYNLMAGYPLFSFSDDGSTAEEEYLIKRDDVEEFYNLSFPPPVVFGDQIIVPTRRPMPGAGSFTTKTINIKPLKESLPQTFFGQGTNLEEFENDYCIASISYGTAESAQQDGDTDPNDPETFLEVSFDTSAEIFKINSSTTFGEENDDSKKKYEDEEVVANINDSPDTPATTVIPTTTYNMNWKLALNPNIEAFRALIGKVNGMRDPLFFNAPRDTILYAGFSGRRQFLFNPAIGGLSITPWNLNFKFIGKEITGRVIEINAMGDTTFDGQKTVGWNHVFHKEAWRKVFTAGGDPLYSRTTTFTQMFQIGNA